jgi:glucosamine-6-phosphate deaminase
VLILVHPTAAAMSARAARIVANAIRRKPGLVLGLPTGETPRGLYRELVRLHREEALDFSHVVTFNLDEYLGLSPEHPQSFHAFMRRELFDHVNVRPGNVHVPDGSMSDRFAERCDAYEAAIRAAGGIDLMVVGIGREGHVGFNEPTSSFASRTRVKTLTGETIAHNRGLFAPGEEVPECAVTMGIGTILDARRILLLANGVAKAKAVASAIEGPIASACSASALQTHANVTALLDESAASLLRHLDYYRRVEVTTARLTPERLD